MSAGAVPAAGIAVIGGGWSGLAAAVTLSAAGVPVTLFESAQTLGGRARRVVLDGVALDNGQHLLSGAYRDTLALIRQVHAPGTTDGLFARMPLQLAGPGTFLLRAANLPAPLHMAVGLLRAQGCTIAERVAVIRAFARWRGAGWRPASGQTVAALLDGQPAAIVSRLWEPLCLAALNTPIAVASARIFLNVLRDALAADRAASDLIVPIADLSRLFPDPAVRFIEARGGTVRRGARVRRLATGDAGIVVETADSAHAYADVVVATAPWQAAELLRPLPPAAHACACIDGYSYQPIATVYLRFDRPVTMGTRMLQLGAGPGQWLFDRSEPGTAGALLAVVISADGPHRQLDATALVRAIAAQLRENLPGCRTLPEPAWSRVITERRATHAATPGRAHPPAGHLGAGVHLAGDHTDPDYPATIEAAVRSGLRAAHGVLARRR